MKPAKREKPKTFKFKIEARMASLHLARKYLEKKGYQYQGKAHLLIKKSDTIALATLLYLDFEKVNPKLLKVNFSLKNGKLTQAIPAIALSPWITCNDQICFKCGACYGLKMHYIDLNKFIDMVENTYILNNHPEFFKAQINAFLTLYPVKYFRWFENGDFPSVESVKIFDEIARENKRVHFLGMSKQYKKVNEYLTTIDDHKFSKNLMLKFSKFEIAGLGEIENPYNLPITDVINKKEELHEGAILCPGMGQGCINCLKCWHRKEEIDFLKH